MKNNVIKKIKCVRYQCTTTITHLCWVRENIVKNPKLKWNVIAGFIAFILNDNGSAPKIFLITLIHILFLIYPYTVSDQI